MQITSKTIKQLVRDGVDVVIDGKTERRPLIEDFDPSLLEAGAYDLRIGKFEQLEDLYLTKHFASISAKIANGIRQFARRLPITSNSIPIELSSDGTITLRRLYSVYATTLERINAPANLRPMIEHRVSAPNGGLYVACTSCNPGYSGQPTFRLWQLGLETLTLGLGESVAKVWFLRLEEDEPDPYHGPRQGGHDLADGKKHEAR